MHVSTSSINMPPSATGANTSAHGQPQPHVTKLKRIDTQDLKSKLATALGSNDKRYWSALLHFMTAKIDRTEFEEEAMMCLKPQHVHLHNSLVLGLLYNASADVPGPSARSAGGLPHERDTTGQLVDVDGNVVGGRLADLNEDLKMLPPAKKRLRLLAAGLSRKDRARVRSMPKHLSHPRSLAQGGALSLGWAGAGADMLEKKRKEEEKRRSVEEKQRVKEAYTTIGAQDWKTDVLQSQSHTTNALDRLAASTQQEIARALAMPLCVESKQLPDLESMRDLMTFQAVENGLTRGAQPQAAALLLAALQCHLQNIMASIITKIRANRQMGIRTTGIHHTASEDFALLTADSAASSQEVGDESLSISTEVSPSTAHRALVRRTMLHGSGGDASSVSSSSTNLGVGSVMTGGDVSMLSLASTAPTSLPAGSIASSEHASGPNSSDNNAVAKGGEEGGAAETSMSDGHEPAANQTALKRKHGVEHGSSAAPITTSSTLELRHLSFLLDLAPHTVVESLGQGPQERLLAADWTHADEDAQRAQERTGEGMLQRQARLAACAKMSSVSAGAGGGSSPSQSASSASSSSAGHGHELASTRSKYVIDQLAPVRLFDRRTLAETQAAAEIKMQQKVGTQKKRWNVHEKKGGLRLPSSGATSGEANAGPAVLPRAAATDYGEDTVDENKVNLAAIMASRYGGAQVGNAATPVATAGILPATFATAHHNTHHRGQDPYLYDVVDPVALLASLIA